jgi:hypothetical protein
LTTFPCGERRRRLRDATNRLKESKRGSFKYDPRYQSPDRVELRSRERADLSRRDCSRNGAAAFDSFTDRRGVAIEGLIEELSGESTGGRPPILLSFRTADAVAIGVDLGTTRTIVATSDLAGRVLDQEEFETDPNAENTTKEIIDRAQRLIRRNKGTIEGIGVSLPDSSILTAKNYLFPPSMARYTAGSRSQ